MGVDGVQREPDGAEEPEVIDGAQVTPGMLRGWGAKLMLGRDFLPEEGSRAVTTK